MARPERQVLLARLIRQPGTDVISLDRVDATSTGRLLAASGLLLSSGQPNRMAPTDAR